MRSREEQCSLTFDLQRRVSSVVHGYQQEHLFALLSLLPWWRLEHSVKTFASNFLNSQITGSERVSSSLQPSKFGVFSWKQHLTVIQYCFACIKSFNATSIWESPHSEVDSDMLCSKHFLFSCSSLTIFSDAGCSMLMLPLYPTDFACHCLTCLFLFWEPMHTCIMGLAKREWRITTGIDSNP